jgi:hypothetical protein
VSQNKSLLQAIPSETPGNYSEEFGAQHETDQQINRSTDQQINRSTDQHCPLSKRVWSVCLVVICLAMSGCGEGSLAAVSTPKETTASAGNVVAPGPIGRTIDAGIVLADRDGYFCLPLEQVGLPPDAEIVSLESSCECVQPRLVQYVADRQRIGQAILLEYIPEVSSAEADREDNVNRVQPANLGVIVEVGLADRTKHGFTINLLHTVLQVEETVASGSEYRS